MSEIAIRPFELRDYDAVSDLFLPLDAAHRSAVPELFRTIDGHPRSLEYFQKLVESDSAAVLVAEDGGAVVGLVLVLLRDPPPFPMFIPQRTGVIDNIVVAPSHQRRGIGSRLLRTGEAWLRSAGARWLELNVYEFNEGARAFYETAGYGPLMTRMGKTAVV